MVSVAISTGTPGTVTHWPALLITCLMLSACCPFRLDCTGPSGSASAPLTVTVSPPPSPPPPPLASTALGKLAASMAPGTWAQLTTSNQDAVIGVGNVSGSTITYSNSMPWNPFSKVIEITGSDHGWGHIRYMRYDEATNQFVLVADDPGLGPYHGQDETTVNPYTGDVYRRVDDSSSAIDVRRKLVNVSTFSALGLLTGQPYQQVANGTCWWSGPFVGGGSQGAFMTFNGGNSNNTTNDGQIAAYNPLTNTWFYNQEGRAPNYGSGFTYNSLIEYSRVKNVAVYGGGDAAPDRLWRISSDCSVLAMPNVPAGKEVGMQGGSAGLFVDEPVTGNFLLLSEGELWELNPSGAGTWTQQTGARVPPSGVGAPSAAGTPPKWVIASSIPEYGVVAFITQPGNTGGTFFLYKHQ